MVKYDAKFRKVPQGFAGMGIEVLRVHAAFIAGLLLMLAVISPVLGMAGRPYAARWEFLADAARSEPMVSVLILMALNILLIPLGVGLLDKRAAR